MQADGRDRFFLTRFGRGLGAVLDGLRMILGSGRMLAFEFLDYPMGRRRMGLRARARFARRHTWEMLGLGLPLLLGSMVPVLGAACMPVGVAGGTLLLLRLRGEAEPG